MWRKASYLRSASFAALSTLPVIAAFALLGTTEARADYVAMLSQVPDSSQPSGFDVVATGSGAFDPTGLNFVSNSTLGLFITPNQGALFFAGPVQVFRGVSTSTTMFGPGGTSPSGSGTLTEGGSVGVNLLQGATAAGGFLYVPIGYVPGTELTDSAIWNNMTFASLGITPGDYVGTWGNGGPNQSFTICTAGNCPAAPPEIPLPAALPLFGTGLGAMGLLGWRRKRKPPRWSKGSTLL